MRRLAPILALTALAGCSMQPPEQASRACGDSAAIEKALAASPGPVELGGHPLSRCLPRDASGADVQQAGITFTQVAGRLADRRDAVGLGYLMGAARRGARRSQTGVYAELLRRLELELNAVNTHAPEFKSAEAAGRASG